MNDSASDYRQMWSDLGLDLDKHDLLLGVLGQAYQDVYLSQAERPEGMSYFDFVMSEVHGLRIKEIVDARAKGSVVVGSFCVFVPEELVLAVDGVSVGLCAGAEFGFDKAEKHLPINTCSLIKSAFGFAEEKVCPYLAVSDVIVGENTCDGKKKSYEAFSKLLDGVYVMDLPQVKSPKGKDLLKAEYLRFVDLLESKSGKKMDAGALKAGIETVNAKRRAVQRLAKLRKAAPSPISGLDALLINQVFFYDNPQRFTDSVNKICDELETRVAQNKGVAEKRTPRILVSGCPMAVPNWKLPAIVEGSGAVIVGEESCVGERGTQNLTSTEGATVEQLIDNLVDRYFDIDCAVFTPNPTRVEHAMEMAREYKADGIIHYNLQFCQPYQIEAIGFEKSVEDTNIPVLRIDTDYSAGDSEQLKTRVEAFIEQINQ